MFHRAVDKFTGLSESTKIMQTINPMPSAIIDTKVAGSIFDRREKFTRYWDLIDVI